jgi:hypothetical protein
MVVRLPLQVVAVTNYSYTTTSVTCTYTPDFPVLISVSSIQTAGLRFLN